MAEPIRFAIVGTGQRGDYLYGPLLQKLSDEVELVAVWGRSENKARALAEKFDVPWFTNLEQLRDEMQPEAAVVNVAYAANGEVGRMVVELGLHALLETPIAHDLEDADAIIARAKAQGLKIEVAEQYYRRPNERIKLVLLNSGLFGRVNVAYNDFMGHGYHGFSLIRSYIGFDVPIVAVSGTIAHYPTAPHYAWISKSFGPREEEWQHAVLHFAGGRLGFFNWSGLAYDSPLRWLRSTKFFAERGMAVGDELALLTPDGRDALPIRIERRVHNIGGMETLDALVAYTKPEVEWRNPFRSYDLGDDWIAAADCVMSLVRAIREDHEPDYGAEQARLDQQVVLAMEQSARLGGLPVALPG